MFTKLKKKIAEEAAISPRPGGAARIAHSVSKESIASAGADSGDDFASDGSSSRDDLPSQISRRNDQIRRLEAKLSDYAEKVCNLQKMKEKLELALEKHQDSTVRKFREQNEAHQAHQAKMAKEHALALEKKDQLLNKEEVLNQVEHELELLQTKVVVASQAECYDAQELSTKLKEDLQKALKENEKLSQLRTELTTAQGGAEKKITVLEQRQQELQDFILHLSLDFQKAQSVCCSAEKRLCEVQEKYEALSLHHEQFKSKVRVEIEEKDALIVRLQERVNLLEKTLEGSFSGDKALQELLKKVSPQEVVAALHEPLYITVSRESNGEVGVDDIPQLQRENQELEQQIVEKNKTIKQLQQRMVELKKTLQKELKLKPETEVNDVQEKPNPDSLATSLSVTCSSDLTDSRDINFEYLKHVVLKFMSAREGEAFHLIKAVSVLLNFSVEEENLLKETLEYKMSWFGSKPVPKGTVRPSISKSRTTWS